MFILCHRITSERAEFIGEKIIGLFPKEDKVSCSVQYIECINMYKN